MIKFLQTILKFIIIPCLVLLLSIVGYFIFDPLRVLYDYNDYSHTHTDRDYYSVEIFKKKYPRYKYDSFIFGSSRTLAFHPNSWKDFIEPESSPFMLDGYGDNIYGIYHKIKYLDSLNVKMNNVLILLDVDETFTRDHSRSDFFFYLKHPDIDKSSWSDFYWKHFIGYFDPNVIMSYYLNKFFGIKNKYIYNYIGNIRASVDSVTNQLTRDDLEKKIKIDAFYYQNPIFYERADTIVYREDQINEKQKLWLNQIQSIFNDQNTDYKIIIGPMYTQSKFSKKDLVTLIDIFGSNRVYDFSGVNDFTTNKRNYYETSHYRPLVGDSIMHYIYTHPGNVEIQ